VALSTAQITFEEPLCADARVAAPDRREWIWLALLVLLVTVLNAIKPLHIDDAAFYPNAKQTAEHPLDPYGFTAFWSQWPEPGIWQLCPPVLPYWWAIAIRLFGNSPVMWKLWLMPFVAVFVVSLHRLFRRFAHGMEMPLLLLTVLSPTFLPALNLMMDIPALALGLASLCIGLRAIDDDSISLSIFSGVLAALAMETKYTAAIVPAAVLIYAMLHRRLWFGILPGLIAAILFAMCEGLIFHRYGVSQFVFYLNLHESMKGLGTKDLMWSAVPVLLGALIPMIGLLGLASLNLPRAGLVLVAAGVLVGYVAIAFTMVATLSFAILGIGVCAVVVMVVYDLAKDSDVDDVFVILWLALELVGCIAISPFAASRRTMGLVVVVTVVVGRLAARVNLPQRRRGIIRWIVGGSVALGLGYYFLDLAGALAQKHAVEQSAAVVDSLKQPGQKVWFVGHWGFQYYAEQAGYQPVVPDHSVLRAGDWLIYPHPLIDAQHATIPPDDVDEIQTILIDDGVPLSTVPFYYGGGVPVEHRRHPRVTVSIYRVKSEFVPLTNYLPQFVTDWAIDRRRPLPPASMNVLLRLMEQTDPATAGRVGKAILDSGPAALAEGLSDADPAVRQTARKLLQSH
jgi:hypothetical protein